MQRHFFSAIQLLILASAINALPQNQQQITFAPYGDVGSGFDPASFQSLGITHFTLAFANADCSTFSPVIAQGQPLSSLNNLIVNQITPQNAILSIGGALQSPQGSMPAACASQLGKSPQDLANLYQAYLDAYKGLSWLDFDIEGPNIDNVASVDLRSQAIALLQKKNPSVTISVTLPVAQSGLISTGLYVLESAKKNGARIDVVNIMAMNYGPAIADMGNAAIDASVATLAQIKASGLDAKLGITPMTGPNDTPGETFTTSDAANVAAFAAGRSDVAFVSYWSLNRDSGGEFAKIFAPFAGYPTATSSSYQPSITQPTSTYQTPVAQSSSTYQPSITQPTSTYQPSITQPTSTYQSPVTQPSATQTPVTQTPVTQPSVTQTPVTQTPVTQSPVTATQTPVTQSPVTQHSSTYQATDTQAPYLPAFVSPSDIVSPYAPDSNYAPIHSSAVSVAQYGMLAAVGLVLFVF